MLWPFLFLRKPWVEEKPPFSEEFCLGRIEWGWVAVIPLLAKKSLTFAVSCSLALYVCSLLTSISHNRCIFTSDFIIASPASLFCSIIWTSIQPEKELTMIWIYLFPPVSDGVIGPVVSDDRASSSFYLLCSSCMKGAFVSLPCLQCGQGIIWFVVLIFSITCTASGYSLQEYSIVFLFAWFSTSWVCLCLIYGAILGPLFLYCYLPRCLWFLW